MPFKDLDYSLQGVDYLLDHLPEKPKITIFSNDLVECPACLKKFELEENCFEHVLNHFENSQHFLLQRCNLINWITTFVKRRDCEPAKEILQQNNDLNKPTKDILSCDIERDDCLYELYPEQFSNFHQIVGPLFGAKLNIPAIDTLLKCPLCEKYHCSEESALKHLFTHITPDFTNRRPYIITWFAIFTTSVEGHKILQKYEDYETKVESHLLSKITVSEVHAVKSCKICEEPVSSIFDLFENHSNCKVPVENSVYCVLCNFKFEKVKELMSHFFVKHIHCYCGYHGEDFATFLIHTKNCQVYKNGLMCPLCCVHKFVSVGAFKEHVEDPAKRSCGTLLRNFKWACLLCKQKFPPNEMFHHIFTVHVGCLCGLRFKDFRSFCFHVNKCSEKSSMVVCPVCNKIKCYSEEAFEDHVLNCLPWKRSQEEKLSSSPTIHDIQAIFLPNEIENLISLWEKHKKNEVTMSK